jgi:hypothetical protein
LTLATGTIVVLVAGFLDLVIDRVVPEVGAGGIRSGDRDQQVVYHRHP